MKVSHFILGFFVSIAVVLHLYFSLFSLVIFIIQNILLAITFFLLFSILGFFRQTSARIIVIKFTLMFMSFFGILVMVFGVFVSYYNTFPAKVSNITLSDGTGSVVFVSMSHIATPEFFSQQNTRIRSLASSWYTILMEWVHAGTPENHEKFDRYMGLHFTESLYSTLASITWLASQDVDILYSGVSTGSLQSVDLSVDEIVSLIDPVSAPLDWPVIDLESELADMTGTLSKRDQYLLHFVSRWLLNWSLSHTHEIEWVLREGTMSPVFTVILQKRNDPIIEYIRTHPWQKIAVVYWALHFNGIYEWLQKISPQWHIQFQENITPYQ